MTKAETIFIGIDPGASGGLARIHNGTAEAYKMPETERDVWDLLRSWIDDGVFALIERVHSSPQMGVSSAFSFGCNYAGLRMALIASGMPFEEVMPGKWQQSLGISVKGKGFESADHSAKQRERKLAAKAKAQQLFPQLKITNAIADALLIAEYLRRMKSA